MAVKVRKTEYNPEPDNLSGFLGKLGNYGTDRLRENANGISNIIDWFASKSKPTRSGDTIYGVKPKDSPAEPNRVRPASAYGPDLRGAQGSQTQAPVDPIQQLLDLATKYGYTGGDGTDYNGLRSTLQSNANASDARIAAMYDQLRGQIGADAVPLGGIFDTAANSLNSNSDLARGNVQSAAQAGMDAQTDQLNKLGIQQALGTSGGSIGGDAQHVLGNIEQNRATNLNQNTSHKTNALAFNEGQRGVASLNSGEARTKIQQDLAAQLAQLGVQQSQGQQNNVSKQLQFGQQIYNTIHGDPADNAKAVAAQAAQNKALADFVFKQNTAEGKAAQAIWQTVYKQTNGDSTKADAEVARLAGTGLGFNK